MVKAKLVSIQQGRNVPLFVRCLLFVGWVVSDIWLFAVLFIRYFLLLVSTLLDYHSFCPPFHSFSFPRFFFVFLSLSAFSFFVSFFFFVTILTLSRYLLLIETRHPSAYALSSVVFFVTALLTGSIVCCSDILLCAYTPYIHIHPQISTHIKLRTCIQTLPICERPPPTSGVNITGSNTHSRKRQQIPPLLDFFHPKRHT